jgi:hypothetical protein
MIEWKLVPVEPTEEMVRIGAALIDDNGGNARWSDVREAWSYMLAASPPAPSAEPVITDAMVEAGQTYIRSVLRVVGLPDEYIRGILRAALEGKR